MAIKINNETPVTLFQAPTSSIVIAERHTKFWWWNKWSDKTL